MKLVAVREVHDGPREVAVVTMAAPPANALSESMTVALDAALDEVAAIGAHAIVLESSLEGYFAVGADLKLLATLDSSGFDEYLSQVTRMIERLASLETPTIAALSGHVVGGGLELAMACSLRIAAADARLALPEIKLGLLPGAGGTQRLPRLVGRARALDLLLSGRSISPEEGLAWGLVDRVVPPTELAQSALDAALQLARMPREAVAAILRCVDASIGSASAEGLALEAHEIRALFATDAARAGIAAFVEEREPRPA